MDQKELVVRLNRIIEKRVSAEVEKRVSAEVEKRLAPLKLEMMSEVAGMLQYMERKILSEQMQAPQHQHHGTPNPINSSTDNIGMSDFERSMQNMKSMPNYSGVDKVKAPPKQITKNPMLNDILNETAGFDREESRSVGTSLADIMQVGGSRTVEPWDDTPRDIPSFRAPSPVQPIPKHISGIDGKVVDTNNPTVQKVLDVLQNTNFKEKYDRMVEAGNSFRDNGHQAPRHSTNDIKSSLVD